MRQDLEHAAGGVDRIVVAEVAVGEEDVPAHLAAEGGAGLPHLRLQQRVPRLPHDPAPAVLRDIVIQPLRTFHLGDDDRAGLPREDVACEHDEHLVAPIDPPAAVDEADAIGVTVERDADVGAVLLHRRDEVGDVLRQRRIGVVVREPPIRIAEDRVRLASHRLEDARRDGSRGAVPGHCRHASVPCDAPDGAVPGIGDIDRPVGGRGDA